TAAARRFDKRARRDRTRKGACRPSTLSASSQIGAQDTTGCGIRPRKCAYFRPLRCFAGHRKERGGKLLSPHECLSTPLRFATPRRPHSYLCWMKEQPHGHTK